MLFINDAKLNEHKTWKLFRKYFLFVFQVSYKYAMFYKALHTVNEAAVFFLNYVIYLLQCSMIPILHWQYQHNTYYSLIENIFQFIYNVWTINELHLNFLYNICGSVSTHYKLNGFINTLILHITTVVLNNVHKIIYLPCSDTVF